MKSIRPKLVVPLVAITFGVWLGRAPLQEWIRDRATLANSAPPPDVVEEMIEHAADPGAALLAAWNSGKIIHREAAIRELRKVFPSERLLPAPVRSLLLSAALDPDMNVRETALAILRERNHPALTALAAAQLQDPDQQVRLLGLSYLKLAPPALGVPLAAGLLDDSDPAVLGFSVKLLENWSGEDFGVKLSDTVMAENETNGLEEFKPEGVAKTQAAAAKARAWWAAHRSDFAPVHLEVPPEASAARQVVAAADFALRTLDGRTVRLMDYRGRLVLINFWTTWCTACVGEIPALTALQNKFGDKVVILGVSLDNVPDEHGHVGGHPAAEDPARQDGDHSGHDGSATALEQVRAKVARVARARGINYPVLLDEHNEVGGCYNGGELPTTVLVDAHGNVRRRFIGARSLPVFEAMFAEASSDGTNRLAARLETAGSTVTPTGKTRLE